MKKICSFILVACTVMFMAACGGSTTSNTYSHEYAGTFSVADGITFTLNPDSTTLIHFDANDADYESTWKVVNENGEEWVNIEFAGDQEYYYLKNGKLYRSHMNMDHDYLGWDITYIE